MAQRAPRPRKARQLADVRRWQRDKADDDDDAPEVDLDVKYKRWVEGDDSLLSGFKMKLTGNPMEFKDKNWLTSRLRRLRANPEVDPVTRKYMGENERAFWNNMAVEQRWARRKGKKMEWNDDAPHQWYRTEEWNEQGEKFSALIPPGKMKVVRSAWNELQRKHRANFVRYMQKTIPGGVKYVHGQDGFYDALHYNINYDEMKAVPQETLDAIEDFWMNEQWTKLVIHMTLEGDFDDWDYHASLVILDRKFEIVEYFDPWGNSNTNYNDDFLNKLHRILQVPQSWTWMTANFFCSVHWQGAADKLPEDMGYCEAWTSFYADARIHSTMHPCEVKSRLTFRFRNDSQLSYNFIKAWAHLIAQYKEALPDKIGVRVVTRPANSCEVLTNFGEHCPMRMSHRCGQWCRQHTQSWLANRWQDMLSRWGQSSGAVKLSSGVETQLTVVGVVIMVGDTLIAHVLHGRSPDHLASYNHFQQLLYDPEASKWISQKDFKRQESPEFEANDFSDMSAFGIVVHPLGNIDSEDTPAQLAFPFIGWMSWGPPTGTECSKRAKGCGPCANPTRACLAWKITLFCGGRGNTNNKSQLNSYHDTRKFFTKKPSDSNANAICPSFSMFRCRLIWLSVPRHRCTLHFQTILHFKTQ
jgi:hypothetical protein